MSDWSAKEFPTVEQTPDSPIFESRETHPSYAMIGAAHASGDTYLFGSDFTHHGFVEITIKNAESIRSLNNDRYHSRKEIVHVMLSEAQWAAFVSRLNMGDGVPCTLRWQVDIGWIPQIAGLAVDRKNQFKREISERFDLARGMLRNIAATIAGSALPMKTKEHIRRELDGVEMNIGSNQGFAGEQAGKFFEDLTEKAKTEVNAYVTSVVQRAGLDAIAGASQGPILELESGDGKL